MKKKLEFNDYTQKKIHKPLEFPQILISHLTLDLILVVNYVFLLSTIIFIVFFLCLETLEK